MPTTSPIGKYDGGRYVPNVHSGKAIIGYDALTDAFNFIATDEDGALLCRQQFVNIDTLEWENAIGGESSPTSRYIISDMDTSSDPSYYGYVDRAGNWYIMRLNTATGETRYAKGTTGYAAAWTGKAGQSYDYFSVTF